MAETPIDAFDRRSRPRRFEDVCVLGFDDDCATDELSWFSVGIDSRVREGIQGFVFELAQFHRHRPLEDGLGELARFMPLVHRSGGILNWLHGERFVAEWKRLGLLGIPPDNFETEREAVEALQTVFKAARIRAGLASRLTNCGLSSAQIANATGLFEDDVRRIATDQQEPTDALALMISSTLDSLTPKGAQDKPKGGA